MIKLYKYIYVIVALSAISAYAMSDIYESQEALKQSSEMSPVEIVIDGNSETTTTKESQEYDFLSEFNEKNDNCTII
ncbi:MAG: hypothetical protein WC707_03620 [Candidatus Babeliaceae bacterium]|jgi:hypothetical protein